MRVFYEIGGYDQSIFITEEGVLLEKCTCTCKFGSFYRFSKKNVGKICRHLQQALDEYKYDIENRKTNGLQEEQ
jgi:hypothetical protein